MNPFRSKIKCLKCGKKYRRKVEKNTPKFICGGYHNGNGCAERIVIFEEDIRELINKRYEKIMSDEEIINILDIIKIENKHLFEIHFKDGSDPILFKETFIHF